MPCTRGQLIWILTWIVSGYIMKILIWNWDLLNSNWKIRGQKFLMFMIWWARKKWIVSKLVSNTYTIESPMSHLQVTGDSPMSHPGVNRKSILSHPKSPVSQLYVTEESILTVIRDVISGYLDIRILGYPSYFGYPLSGYWKSWNIQVCKYPW